MIPAKIESIANALFPYIKYLSSLNVFLLSSRYEVYVFLVSYHISYFLLLGGSLLISSGVHMFERFYPSWVVLFSRWERLSKVPRRFWVRSAGARFWSEFVSLGSLTDYRRSLQLSRTINDTYFTWLSRVLKSWRAVNNILYKMKQRMTSKVP